MLGDWDNEEDGEQMLGRGEGKEGLVRKGKKG